MEINLNSNGFGNIGMGRGMSETTGIDAGRETIDASQNSHVKSLHVSNLSSNVQAAGLASAEPVGKVPEEALSQAEAAAIADEVFARLTDESEIIATADVRACVETVLRERGLAETARHYMEYRK